MKDLKKCKTKEEILRYYVEKQKQKQFEKELKKIVELEEWKKQGGKNE